MTTLREAAHQALEALERYRQMMFAEAGCRWDGGDAAITALRAALAQQDEPVEPVATLIAQRDVLLEALKWLDRWMSDKTMPECRWKVRGTIDAVEGENHAKSL